MTTADLYTKRFVLFSGKGGVGKTAIASSFALSCARRGERTLLIELNVKNKTSSLFGAARIDSEIREVDENLYAVNVTPQDAMREYAMMVLKIKLVYRAVFENRLVRSFLRVIPGLNELVMLGKAYYHAIEVDGQDQLVWDKVIVDAPATGHGIFFLKIPSVITGLIGSGLMFDEARRIMELLQDPVRTALVLVTLAEDMPVNETLMLSEVVREEMGISVACVIANAIYRPLFSSEEAEWIEAARREVVGRQESVESDNSNNSNNSDEIGGYLEAARFRNDRVRMQAHYLAKLRAKGDWPMVQVPHYFHDRMSFAVIDEIASYLGDALEDSSTSNSNRSAG